MRTLFTFLVLSASISSYSQDINIPDTIFLNKLINQGIDTSEDGIIQLGEALAVTELNVNSTGTDDKIESMQGIEYFTNLVELRCSNNLITSLDVTALINLEILYCFSNQLTSLDINGLTQLTSLWAHNNGLTEIDLNGLDNIWWIWISDNNLDEIDLTGLESLEAIWIANNHLSDIDFTPTPNLNSIEISDNFLTGIEVSHLSQLSSLGCSNNQIEEISISNLENLQSLYIGGNLVEQIDGSQNPNLIELHCESNPNLTYINMKNGAISYSDPDLLFFGFYFFDLPQLAFICMDEGEEQALAESGYDPENVIVSTTDCTMSIDDESLSNVALYPNPIKDFFNLTNIESISKYKVVDILGITLFESPHYEKTRKEILNLKTGIYFLILKSKQNRLKHFKFIKK